MFPFVSEADEKGVFLREWDRTRRRFIRRDSSGAVLEERPFNAEENAAQDAELAEAAKRLTLEERVAAIEARLGLVEPVPVSGQEPTFAALVARQRGAIYTGQRFRWIDGSVREAVTGPLSAAATPATYPQGYRTISGGVPSAPAWTVGTAYVVGDLVSYGGKAYRVLQAHVAQATWTPDAVPALYSLA